MNASVQKGRIHLPAFDHTLFTGGRKNVSDIVVRLLVMHFPAILAIFTFTADFIRKLIKNKFHFFAGNMIFTLGKIPERLCQAQEGCRKSVDFLVGKAHQVCFGKWIFPLPHKIRLDRPHQFPRNCQKYDPR